MKDDLSEPPSQDGAQKPPGPLQSLKRNWLATTFLTAAAYDDPELIAKCPPGERNGAIVRGMLLFAYVALLAISFAVIGHDLLQSSFSPAIVLGAIFLAAFLGLVDHYVMLRTAVFPDGMKGLRRGGFGVDVKIGAGFSSKFCKTLRIVLSLGLGGVIALFIGLALNAAAVDKRITMQHLVLNKVLVQQAVTDFNARRLRASIPYDSAVAAEKILLDQHSQLLKQSNGKSSGRIADRLAANEARLAPVRADREESKRSLDELDANQSQEIERTIRKSPSYIPIDNSVITRLKELFAVIHEDPWVAAPIAVFDAVIIGLDVVILTLKAIAMPSTYAMGDTRRHLREMVRQARLAETETELSEPSPTLVPAEDEKPEPTDEHSDANGVTPPRRGRGRPRKNGVDRPAEEPADE